MDAGERGFKIGFPALAAPFAVFVSSLDAAK
jgi:hypothetical protein